jgi:acyl carrier protein phosphodiesterase
VNYLAHAYLSFNKSEVLVGNMISDFVKGKKKFDYAPGIQTGITLHRAIDQFTDEHAATRQAKKIFQPVYRLYGAAFMDVIYDHFLANDESEFPGNALQQFAQQVYKQLEQYTESFPPPFADMFPYMKQYDWLYNYRQRSGIRRSFEGLAHRALYIKESNTAFALFENHYGQLEECYREFFPALKDFSLITLQQSGNHI